MSSLFLSAHAGVLATTADAHVCHQPRPLSWTQPGVHTLTLRPTMALISYFFHPPISRLHPPSTHVDPLNRNVVTALQGLHVVHGTMPKRLLISLFGSRDETQPLPLLPLRDPSALATLGTSASCDLMESLWAIFGTCTPSQPLSLALTVMASTHSS